MPNRYPDEYPLNHHCPVQTVKHAELQHVSDSLHSRCPVCKVGELLVKRERDILAAEDICTVCGQRFIYSDIDELREMEAHMQS